MAPTDPHQGGRLEDMAQYGTRMPNDAGIQRTIPSVPRPDQKNPPNDLSQPSQAAATDNSYDIPRGTMDRGETGAVMTGTGGQMPANIEKKHFDDSSLHPASHGHDREMKHQKGPELFTSKTHPGHGFQPAPGEEEMSQEEIMNRRK
ncbi:hypothetical protein GQ43DRAFT_41777 [Delitschia confertaspora ATCC 74209]|uniref:Uncharacterized protein n=1 Tax=Delitschia confertaspora ATCC 74209 TaxID=1513339 RepID=A0A9P4MS91_9PLEO|nr:hypothetical protein GQ43DRAFT_41777 [Delitschia confertaspora ATCC 74209]